MLLPTASQSRMPREEPSETSAVTTGLILCRCQHYTDTALRKHRTLLPRATLDTTALGRAAWTVTSENKVHNERSGVCQTLSSQGRAGADIQRLPAECSGPSLDLWCGGSGTRSWTGSKKLSDFSKFTRHNHDEPGLCPPRHVAFLGGWLLFLAPGCQGGD